MQKETDELHNMLQDPEWRKELHAKFSEDKERAFSPVLNLEEVAKFLDQKTASAVVKLPTGKLWVFRFEQGALRRKRRLPNSLLLPPLIAVALVSVGAFFFSQSRSCLYSLQLGRLR